MTWGVEDNVIERFVGAGVPAERISFERDTYTFNFPGTPSEFLAEFRTYYGPTMNAFEAAAANGREAELQAELEALFNAQNASPSRTRPRFPRRSCVSRLHADGRGQAVKEQSDRQHQGGARVSGDDRDQAAGTFEVRRDGRGRPGQRWSRRQAAALVKLLALSPGRRLHREQVIDALWPDLAVDEAAPRLHKAAHFARKAAGETPRPAGESVALFPTSPVAVDVALFEAAAARRPPGRRRSRFSSRVGRLRRRPTARGSL